MILLILNLFIYIYIYIYIYNELEVYIAIKNFKNNVKPLKELQRIRIAYRKIKNKTKYNTIKIKLNLLNYEINYILGNLELELKHGTHKNRFFKTLDIYEDKIKLRLAAKEKIHQIERVIKEVRNNEDTLLTNNTKISKLLTDSKYKEEDILYDIMTFSFDLNSILIMIKS